MSNKLAKLEAQMQKLLAQLQDVKDKAEAIKDAEPVMVPTGRFNVEIKEEKTGDNIHTLEGSDSQEAAHLLRTKMYVLLVKKLKQKVSLSVVPEMKKKA